MSKIDWNQVPDFDLLTYSSPCQDFSNAGKQAGGTEGSGTRSSLLWECRRAILAKRPKYLLMENVAALVSSKFIRLFNAWQLELESYGYRNFAKVLNAKDYGVPQNRERIFMVSVLDETARYEFPDPMPLTIRLKDVLEKEVEERYYLSDSKDKRLAQIVTEQGSKIQHGDMLDTYNQQILHETSATILCGIDSRRHHFVAEEPRIDVVGEVNRGLSGKVYADDGLSPTITAGEGVKYNTKILQRGHGYNKGGEFEDVAPTITTSSYENNNNVAEPIRRRDQIRYKQMENGNIRAYRDDDKKSGASELQIISPENVACTVTTAHEPKIIETTHRIRKLTERECFRLMGVSEEDIDKLIYHSGFTVWNGKKYVQVPRISKSRLYKLAGNSIVVDVMVRIFDQLLFGNKNKNQQLEIF